MMAALRDVTLGQVYDLLAGPVIIGLVIYALYLTWKS